MRKSQLIQEKYEIWDSNDVIVRIKGNVLETEENLKRIINMDTVSVILKSLTCR